MRKSDRLFQLTNLLRAHQPITARELSERLSVSERTIYRYIDDLSVSGIPVYGETGVGYRLSEGFELPPLQLTQQELEALIVGVKMVSGWTGAALSRASNSLLCKIEAALPYEISENSEHKWSVRIPGEHARPLDFVHWEEIHECIKNEQWIVVHYKSLSNSESCRVIFPLGLFYWGGKWTLGSWCSLKREYRDFRLDRIRCLEKAEMPTKLPSSANLTNYIEYQKNQFRPFTTDTMLSGV